MENLRGAASLDRTAIAISPPPHNIEFSHSHPNSHMNTLSFLPGTFGAIILVAVFLVTVVVHVCFAFAVWVDGGLMEQHQRRSTFLVGAGLWALATLLGGVFVAGVYWAVHHSTLRPQSLARVDE
jgi:hypothetical protein